MSRPLCQTLRCTLALYVVEVHSTPVLYVVEEDGILVLFEKNDK